MYTADFLLVYVLISTSKRDEGASSMEHGERAEGRDTREGGEGAERESGAHSDEEEAKVAGNERTCGGLAGGIKKKKPQRRSKGGAKSQKPSREAAINGQRAAQEPRCTARVRDAGWSDTALRGVNLNSSALLSLLTSKQANLTFVREETRNLKPFPKPFPKDLRPRGQKNELGNGQHAGGHETWRPSVPPPPERHGGTMLKHLQLRL